MHSFACLGVSDARAVRQVKQFSLLLEDQQCELYTFKSAEEFQTWQSYAGLRGLKQVLQDGAVSREVVVSFSNLQDGGVYVAASDGNSINDLLKQHKNRFRHLDKALEQEVRAHYCDSRLTRPRVLTIRHTRLSSTSRLRPARRLEHTLHKLCPSYT